MVCLWCEGVITQQPFFNTNVVSSVDIWHSDVHIVENRVFQRKYYTAVIVYTI